MLVFMVVQLAGSAGTYPVEISPSFVAKIHDICRLLIQLMHSVARSAEEKHPSGCNRSGRTDGHFHDLTILQFNHMAKKKERRKNRSLRLAGRKRSCLTNM